MSNFSARTGRRKPLAMNPLGNAEMLANVDTDLLDRYECAEILDRLRPDAWASAGISADDPYGRIDPDRRSVLMQPVPLPSGHQICRKLMRGLRRQPPVLAVRPDRLPALRCPVRAAVRS